MKVCLASKYTQRYAECVVWLVQTHADYEQRLQEEVNARLLKERELQHLVILHPNSSSALLEPCYAVHLPCSSNLCPTVCNLCPTLGCTVDD